MWISKKISMEELTSVLDQNVKIGIRNIFLINLLSFTPKIGAMNNDYFVHSRYAENMTFNHKDIWN